MRNGDIVEAEGRGPRSRDREAGSGADGEHTHALHVLEFPLVLQAVARRATSELGADRVRALRPAARAEPPREALAAVDEMVGFLMREEAWAPPRIPDLRVPLRRLAAEGSVLEPDELGATAVLLASCREARTGLLRFSEDLPRVAERARELSKEPDIQVRLERSITEDGQVADDASPRLKRLRRDLRDARAALVRRLEGYIGELSDRLRVEDASVTIRNGRYCIPVRREGRSQVGGIVHDESASRQTLFVEPPLAIEPMNGIRELELEEAREVRRVLRELTDLLRPKRRDLARSLDVLAELDSLYARGRYALGHGGSRPEMGETDGRGEYRVVRGRHPLLLESGEATVPFDLALAEDETLLLVSGPNAGGKTVLLKAMGLLSAMAQSGILPPVGPGTRLPTFGSFFAVIGDEQSIEASLSTFSAQVRNLRRILEESDAASLVLLDEVGSHTDPAEGSALASAVLLRLAERGGLTAATTHLGALKTLAGESARVVNASLQFDPEKLRPTYHLRRDRPGRSYALEIAGRLGLPPEVLEEARARMAGGERALDSVLEELESREAELERLGGEARARRAAADARAEEVARRAAEVRERAEEVERREREVEREARERAEKYLLQARGRVEDAIERLEARYREALEEAGRAAEPAGDEAGEEASAVEEAVAGARREVERALRETRRQKPGKRARSGGVDPAGLGEGDAVRIRSLDRVGTVQEVRGDRVVVSAGGVRLTLPAADLEPAPQEAAPEGGGGRSPAPTPGEAGPRERRPSVEPRMEVDFRGLRVDELEPALASAVDAAIYGDLPLLRIIHGKGTGALRDRVRELLRADARVPRFRPGAFDEGGSGVTVIEFEEGSDDHD